MAPLPTWGGVNANDPRDLFAFAERPVGEHQPAQAVPEERPLWRARLIWTTAGVAALALVASGAVYGVARHSKNTVCTSITSIAANAVKPTGAVSLVASDGSLAEAGRILTDQANLLIFNRELEKAVHLLAADTTRLQTVGDASTGPTNLPQLMALFQSVDEHFKQAQTECGLPAQGLLATGLGTAVTAEAKTVAAAGPIPAATPAPLPAPDYTASADELAAAANDVAQRQGELNDIRGDQGTSPADLAVARYELAAAKQHLADLKGDTLGTFHQALELRGARAYLASAREDLRQATADEMATAADRAGARAVVLKWQNRVKELS
ncbi:hypothetical protein [Actinoplanes awajinensis]|uniref:Uncharacterized protein n=1 Tax=Actinoplanes awajinensis subsp. mycoplanecinus TaxID=135947 RepID=A0A0X3V1U7_9ACTN|nr:hypothetical protein [Actinoplanes awajinensis]KUL38720.1 hypothetical protein ADL15_10910 [Actinoplanes awajinensis subsp. mycoplanecinus]